MSASGNELKITIVATDSASKAFEDVTDAAEKVGPALDKATEGAEKLGPAVDDAVNAVKPLPGKLDELGTSAQDAAKPLNDAGAGMTSLGGAIVTAGEKIPGAAGDIVSGIGEIVKESERTGAAVDKAAIGMQALKGAAVAAGLVLGPLAMGAALSIAGTAVGKLAGLLGGGDGLADRLDETRANAAALNTEILATAAGINNAGQALSLFQGGSAINDMVEDFARLIELQKVFQGGNAAGDFASGAVEGISSYNEAMAEAIALTGEYGLSTEDLVNGNLDLTGSLDGLASSQQMYNDLLAVTGPGQDAVRARLAELVTQLQAGEISTEEFNTQLTWMTQNLQSAYVAPALAEEALRQFAKAAYDAAVNVGLLNTAAEQLQAAGLDSLALNVAVDFDRSALDSTFNTIIGGTNRLAQSSQAVADWASSLTDAGDSISELTRLRRADMISVDAYTNGIAASNRIQEDNAAIQDEILAIQSQHLPLMAELTAQQRAYVESLGDLSAEQQIAALGFMDSAQSAKAMELAYLAADAASGNLGETGEATATKIITAAAQADPVMKQMLLDMGLISEGADGTITVNFPNASSMTESVDNLTASIDALTVAIGGTPPLHTSSNAADTEAEVDSLTESVNGIPDSAHVSITASDGASGVIAQVQAALANLDGSSATVYVRGQNFGISEAARHGGVLGYANGGVVASLAEAGTELLRFQDGGTALVPHPGVYMVEAGTSVLPAPATRAVLDSAANRRGGGGTQFYGPVVIQPQSADLYDSMAGMAIRRGR